jgi:hypothetical protein
MKYAVTLTLDTELDHPSRVEDFVRRAVEGFLNQEVREEVYNVVASPLTEKESEDIPFFLKRQAN